VSCAAANATINIIQRDNLADNCENMGKVLRLGLEQLQIKYPKIIGDVRGMGLMQALELVVDETKNDRTPNAEAATVLMEETKKRGLLIGRGGLHGNILRISPAMNISKSDVENALEKLTDAFQAMNQ
jgi:4-aminobutyrate aminotransferase-like enzyme